MFKNSGSVIVLNDLYTLFVQTGISDDIAMVQPPLIPH